MDELAISDSAAARSNVADFVGRALAKPARRKRRESAARSANDKRPLISLAAGDIERIVNDVEAALIASDRGLYQRAGKIVGVERVPAIAAGDKKITVTSICERGDMALREDASSAAAFEKFDARADGMVPTDPPMAIIQTLLQRGGRLRFPVLAGVVHTPTMRGDGSLLTKLGYDKATGRSLTLWASSFRRSPSVRHATTPLRRLRNLNTSSSFFPSSNLSIASLPSRPS